MPPIESGCILEHKHWRSGQELTRRFGFKPRLNMDLTREYSMGARLSKPLMYCEGQYGIKSTLDLG